MTIKNVVPKDVSEAALYAANLVVAIHEAQVISYGIEDQMFAGRVTYSPQDGEDTVHDMIGTGDDTGETMPAFDLFYGYLNGLIAAGWRLRRFEMGRGSKLRCSITNGRQWVHLTMEVTDTEPKLPAFEDVEPGQVPPPPPPPVDWSPRALAVKRITRVKEMLQACEQQLADLDE
jgi:hypothetical protein